LTHILNANLLYHVGAKSPEDVAKSDRQHQHALAELESSAILHAKRVTAFNILTYVVAAVIGIMGVLWLVVYFVPTLFAGIPVLISFCASMNWLFPLSCTIFFASAVLAQASKIFHERKCEEITARRREDN
jgi:hypothetical protein